MADRSFTVVVERCGVVTLRDEPLPQPMRDGQFDVETVFSGLSTGTDLSWVKGTNPALHRRWNPELGLFMPGSPDVGYPVDKFGYMQVGRVTESATPAVRPGDVVAMTYGHRSAYRADALTDRFVKLPQSLEPVLGIYAAHMGPICANALLHAAADVHGTDVRGLGRRRARPPDRHHRGRRRGPVDRVVRPPARRRISSACRPDSVTSRRRVRPRI